MATQSFEPEGGREQHDRGNSDLGHPRVREDHDRTIGRCSVRRTGERPVQDERVHAARMAGGRQHCHRPPFGDAEQVGALRPCCGHDGSEIVDAFLERAIVARYAASTT